MSSELKSLYATLRRLNLADFLMNQEFENTLIELDLDDEWRDILTDLNDSYESNEANYLAGFFNLLKSLDGLYSFTTFNQEKLIRILISFINWSPKEIDYKAIYQELKKLGFDQSILKKFAEQARALRGRVKVTAGKEIHTSVSKRNPKKVFIIHGHDQVALLELEKLLKEEFKLSPIILKDSPSRGLSTIISKFEEMVKDCEMVIALFTPDDVTVSNHLRARQNVILELGYVLGRDEGKKDRKIIIVKKGQVEIPSDISGVIYFEYTRSIQELHLSLKKQFDYWKSDQ